MSESKPILKRIFYYRWVYLLLLPGLIQLIIFAYGPMYGLQLAFRNWNATDGIWGSPWVGLRHWRFMFNDALFFRAIRNTVTLSFMHLVVGFPFPIILAVLINELRSRKLSRTLQTIFTFPNFLSWIVISGIVIRLFATEGIVNHIAWATFWPDWSNRVLRESGQFRWFLVFSGIWRGAGWSAIIYLASIAGIDPSLYESATVDGANRFHKIWYITWPGLKLVATMMFVLAIGGIMGGNFDQIFNTENPVVRPGSDIIDTFVFRSMREGLPNFGYLTAVGMFNGVINCMLLLTANFVATRARGESLFARG